MNLEDIEFDFVENLSVYNKTHTVEQIGMNPTPIWIWVVCYIVVAFFLSFIILAVYYCLVHDGDLDQVYDEFFEKKNE